MVVLGSDCHSAVDHADTLNDGVVHILAHAEGCVGFFYGHPEVLQVIAFGIEAVAVVLGGGTVQVVDADHVVLKEHLAGIGDQRQNLLVGEVETLSCFSAGVEIRDLLGV